MRREILLKGLVPLLIGAVLMSFGVLTGRNETSVISENTLNDSYPYGFLGNHERSIMVHLFSGNYELHYNFSSTEEIVEFYVCIFDPDGYEVESVYGPPVLYQNQEANLTFETQKTGQHTLIFGGRWISVQADLQRLLQSVKMVYPFEIIFYLGLPLLVGGFVVTLSGVLMREKPTYWLDKL